MLQGSQTHASGWLKSALPCTAAAALSWGDAGDEALTEVYNGGEEDAEEDGDGEANEGTCMRVNAAVCPGTAGLGALSSAGKAFSTACAATNPLQQHQSVRGRLHCRW